MNIELKANNLPTKPGQYLTKASPGSTLVRLALMAERPDGLYFLEGAEIWHLSHWPKTALWSDAIIFTTDQPK